LFNIALRPIRGAKQPDSSMKLDRIRLHARPESWPIRGAFTISRGSKTEAEVVVAELIASTTDGRIVRGRGECVPYARYGETVEGVLAEIEAQRDAIASGLDREALQSAMPPGAARNAIDCAFWDLEAKALGVPAWRLVGLTHPPRPVITAYTLSLDTPEAMARAAAASAHFPVIKLKLGGGAEDLDRVAAVRRSAPQARLIVDVNEGWTQPHLAVLAPALAALDVALIEQPLPAGADESLASYASPVPLGADESARGRESLTEVAERYKVVNIKLDKTGGLTEALKLKAEAEAEGLVIMVGCMVATSLAMAPAFLLAQGAAFVDLDGPLLLAQDREPGLVYTGTCIDPPTAHLWG
jgi:L-alanine-DL-glutamate epimerase-like enolase superfamily enzyme